MEKETRMSLTESYTHKTYYVEVWEEGSKDTYVLQSEWFDSVEKAKEWKRKITFLHHSFNICIMEAECLLNEDGTLAEYEIIGTVEE